jgi:TonB family protein
VRVKRNCLWKWLVAAGFVAVSSSAFAADPEALAKRLHDAAEMSSIDDPALKPWHLKLDVQLYDDQGNPSEKGTIEEWWTSEKDKRVYTMPSYATTEIRDGKTLYRSKGQISAAYGLSAIRRLVVHPMATAEEIDHAKLKLHVQTFGKVKLDCIVLDQQIQSISDAPIGLFPTYCLEHDGDRLRLRDRFGSEASALETFGTFQDRKVAVYASIGVDGHKTIDGHVTVLESKTLEPSIFAVGDELAEVKTGLPADGAKVVAPKVIKSVEAHYPAGAAGQRRGGTVQIAVTVGTDGRVHNLRLVKSLDADLAWSAMDAVRSYIFNPAMSDGTPIETEVIIQVEFHIY